jgi:hypothetical protein
VEGDHPLSDVFLSNFIKVSQKSQHVPISLTLYPAILASTIHIEKPFNNLFLEVSSKSSAGSLFIEVIPLRMRRNRRVLYYQSERVIQYCRVFLFV